MVNWLLTEESGQGMVEYGLIIALVSVVAIAILRAIGEKVVAKFTEVDGALN